MRVRLSSASALLLLPLLGLVAACSEPPSEVVVEESREMPADHRDGIPKMPDRQRFGFRSPEKGQASPSSGGQDPSGAGRTFAWDTPEGWESLPPARFRVINLRVKDAPEAECFLTQLGGDGGGVLGNVNRWRSQMSLEPMDPSELPTLPRAKLLDRECYVVQLDGTYRGMGSEGRENWRMIAALLPLPAVTLTVKMTGPREVLGRERANFDRFLASIRWASQGEDTGTTSGSSASGPKPVAPQSGSKTAADVRWTAPAHWQSGRTSSMRLATFHPKSDPEVELSVIHLPGTGGGLVPNVQRWYEQMTVEAPSEADVGAMRKIEVLGVPGTIVDVEGSYRGMGSTGKPGQRMLGLIAQPTPEFSLYLKMTGPSAKVEAEREAFFAFCKSLRFEQS